MINLPKPYETKCVRDQSLKDMFSLSNAYVYTKKACLIKCRNDYTIDRCGCIPPEYKGMKIPIVFTVAVFQLAVITALTRLTTYANSAI